MKLSIIVPVYNAEKTLKRCMDALLHQTLDDYEIICIDDGSQDSSLSILQAYAKKHSKLIVLSKTNGGQASARNLGLQHAKGDYIGFVDSDDWIDATMYEQMVWKAQETQSDIVVCDMIEHFPSRDVYHDFTASLYPFAQAGSACNKLFLRSIVMDITFPIGLWYEDFNFTTKLLLKTNHVAYIKEGFYHYAYHENSTMHNDNTEKNLDMLTVFKDIMEYAHTNHYIEQHYEDLAYLYLDHVYITTINRISLQRSTQRGKIIRHFITYGKKEFSTMFTMSFYQHLPRNRKIIAKLNAQHHWRISRILLKLKSAR